VAVFREDGRGAEAGGTGSDDDDFRGRGGGHGEQCHSLVMLEIAFWNHTDAALRSWRWR
jgi:hypothetical protein